MAKDPSQRRYRLSGELGSGSFATVYAAQDTKLNREVAIKQLHKQFLSDKDQLERYWQEAQLLGSLEHPNVMTIFDVIKKKGCLVLERMQGTLKNIYGEHPMPVQDVRSMIKQVAQGLKCLHDNGIVHGDIKPSNLFLSKQEIVKLGDFGLARRVADDDGSMIKGTTRYMAPELVSEEFGDVGPASDLYSLGFSALEMLVGPEFESLFPDLIAFGRDRQMAWMMWHCSADRKLPPVQNLLEGVPEDLANVLQKLTAKNQADRYQTAKEVLSDLSGEVVPVGQSLKDEAAAAEELARKKKKKLRITAAISCLLSTAACCAMLFWPEPPEEVAPEIPPDIHGVVRNVRPIDEKLVLDLGIDIKEIELRDGDTISLNRKERPLTDLQEGDRVVVHSRFNDEGKKLYDIVAFRPETHSGVIASINPDQEQFTLLVTEGVESGQEFVLTVPAETPITLNAMDKLGEDVFTIASLAKDDQVVVAHSDDEDGMLALSIDSLRTEKLSGFVRKIDTQLRAITVALKESEQDKELFVRIPLKRECAITLNGLTSLDEKLFQLADLKPGDKVTLEHDVKVKSIDAYRAYFDEGTLIGIDLQSNQFRIKSVKGGNAAYQLPASTESPDFQIKLGDEVVQLADLRVNDVVDLSHDSPGAAAPPVDQLAVSRPVNKKKWALLIGNENFDDNRIKSTGAALSSVSSIETALVNRYAVPQNQILVCNDFGTVRLQKEIADWVDAVPSGAEFYVYLSTRAFGVLNQNVYLAAKDSVYQEMAENPLTLNWLINVLDQCKTKQKLLLLDCSPPDIASDPLQYSAFELVEIAQSIERGGYPRSIYVLGNTGDGQVGSNATLDSKSSGQSGSLFAQVISTGFMGAADRAKDNELEITELADYVSQGVGKVNNNQSPVLILPDASPPRISAEGKADILALLTQFSKKKLDLDQLAADAAVVRRSAPGQPEPMTAYAVLLVKSAKMDQALEIFDAVRLQHPKFVPAYRGAVWLEYYKSRYELGFVKLRSMLDQITTPDEMEVPYTPAELAVFESAGQYRELAEISTWKKRLPTAADIAEYDQAIQKFGESPLAAHQKGRDHIRAVVAEFEKEIAADPESSARLKRGRLKSYMESIANEEMIESIKAGLDK